MMLITWGIGALMLSLSSVLIVKADCNTPGWTPILPNPMQSSIGTITSLPTNQVSAVPRSMNGGDGVKYRSTDNNGVSSVGEYAPGDAKWSVSPGYPYDTFTDFFLFNFDPQISPPVTCLLYIMPDGIYLAQQNMTKQEWSNGIQVMGGSFRYPRATIVAQQVWIAAQNVDDSTITVIFADQLDSFDDRGPLSLIYNGQPAALTPQGQFAMFTGDTPGNPGLWFYWINDLNSLPLLSYVEDYTSTIIVANPSSIGDVPFWNTTSVSAIPSPDEYQALLVRTGYASKTATQTYAAFTVVKIKDGQISEYCDEQLVRWNNNNVASIWAPALTAGSITAGGVTMTWVDALSAALMSLSGTVWD